MTQHQQILKDLIQQSGLSKKQFCEKHEISITKMNHWLNGTRNPQFCTLELIAFDEGFKINVVYEINNL